LDEHATTAGTDDQKVLIKSGYGITSKKDGLCLHVKKNQLLWTNHFKNVAVWENSNQVSIFY